MKNEKYEKILIYHPANKTPYYLKPLRIILGKGER